MNWLPILTAPKDGTKILIFWEKTGHVEDAELYFTEDDEWYHVLFDGDQINDTPTHWMPYPELPSPK